MSLFTVTDASQVFHLTDSAVDKVKGLIADEGSEEALVLRVAVRPGGCSGFSYEMFFDTDVADDDIRSEHEGVTVVITDQDQARLDAAAARLEAPPWRRTPPQRP